MAVIIKKRGVDYFTVWPAPGSDPNPSHNQPQFPEVRVVGKATRSDLGRDYRLFVPEVGRRLGGVTPGAV